MVQTRRIRFGALLLGLLLNSLALVQAQSLKFGQSFDADSKLVSASDEFKFTNPYLLVAVKFTGRAPLPVDTLFVVVKDINGVAGRYYMKRSKKNLSEANSILKLKGDGIYRVFIYNPLRRVRPVMRANLFITGEGVPTKQELIERQRKILVERGVIKDKKTVNTAMVNKEDDAPSDDDIDEELMDISTTSDELAAATAATDDDDDDGDDLDDIDAATTGTEDLAGDFENLDDLDDEMNVDIDKL